MQGLPHEWDVRPYEYVVNGAGRGRRDRDDLATYAVLTRIARHDGSSDSCMSAASKIIESHMFSKLDGCTVFRPRLGFRESF
nr:hypothetical protein CFP56_30793 [Quercus suber]